MDETGYYLVSTQQIISHKDGNDSKFQDSIRLTIREFSPIFLTICYDKQKGGATEELTI